MGRSINYWQNRSKRREQLSITSLWTLQSPYIITGLVPTGFRDLLVSADMLLDVTSFFNLKNDDILNFAINQEKRVDNIFKKLVGCNSISEETRRSLKPIGTRPVIMYGLCKVHKDIIDTCSLLFDLFFQQLIPIN